MKNEKSSHSNFSSQMVKEKVVETKTCKHCEAKFEITDKDLEFYEKVSPVFKIPNPLTPKGGKKDSYFPPLEGLEEVSKKFSIPTPTLCPDCRQQRRLSFRNERKLYKRKCDFSGKDIISIYSPDKKYKVYDQEIWWSDKWDSLDYGKDFDFNKSFFEQFDELMKEVPMRSILSSGENENSEYCQFLNAKNCYLSFVGGNNESVIYSHWMVNTKFCLDCLRCQDIAESYDCTHCYENSYKLYHCVNCYSSSNSYYCYNLINCKNCFLSGNIVNKEFVFKNQQLTKDEYFTEVKKILEINNNILLKERDSYIKNSIHRQNNNIKSELCSGDFLKHCNNANICFEISNSKNCKYFFDNAGDCEDCMDVSYGMGGSLSYDTLGTFGHINCFNIMSYPDVNNIWYCYQSVHSSNLFGCIGLRNKSYCILNKQYTKEEYEILVPKIIEHMMTPPTHSSLPPNLRGIEGESEWGEFFPSYISPFGYNETVAMEYFPITKEEIENSPYFTIVPFSPSSEGDLRGSRRFNWSDYEAPFPKVEKIITVEMYNNTSMLDNANKVPDDILNWAIECEITKKPFRIIKQELEFYRKHNLPIPRRHPDQRHLDRMSLRNPRKLFDRKCDKCKIGMKTTYSPDRKEIVYCEDCYIGEVY